MGVGVSDWRLARAVAMQGQLGVVAGTALATTFARRLQLGDPGGHLRRAVNAFPAREMAQRVFDRYFLPERQAGVVFKRHPLPAMRMPRNLLELTVVASFAEVYLARESHDGVVGVNLMEKIQIPTLATLFGCLLAGVDYVLMGAGIPRAIPGVLDRLARWQPVELQLDVEGAKPGEKFATSLDPCAVLPNTMGSLQRPRFLAIVSAAALAKNLARKASGRVDGFVVEGPSAGGHNAPPRGALSISDNGEPIYGPRDEPDLQVFRELGLPFWLAGSHGRPDKLEAALALGAAGVQVGTAFAFCEESGVRADIKRDVIARSRGGLARVATDPRASPTGFPLKVVQVDGSISETPVFEARRKICDLGYLRQAYRRGNGALGYRCPGEPESDYLKKGGRAPDIAGRKCVCNGLLSTVGLGQTHKTGYQEPPLVTAGQDVSLICEFIPPGQDSYCAADVVSRLLGQRAVRDLHGEPLVARSGEGGESTPS